MNSLATLKNNKPASTTIFLLLLITIYLAHLFVYFGIGGRDDSYITYWSAYALSHFGEIVNYNGDRIEQSSSLLHVVVLALLHKITFVSLPVIGVIFSLTCGLLAALLAAQLARTLELAYARVVPFTIISVPYFTYWSSSGMETSFAALIIVGLMLSLHNYLFKPTSTKQAGVVIAAMIAYLLVRPESFFVLAAFLTALLIVVACLSSSSSTSIDQRSTLQKILLIFVSAGIIFSLLCLWRYHYFGHIFPQPVYAKSDIAHTAARIILGLKYLRYSINLSTGLLTLMSLWAIYRAVSNRSLPVISTVCFVLAYLSFVVTSGGDWMEARRLLVPVIPLLVVLAISAIHSKQQALIIIFLFGCFGFDFWQLREQESIGLTPHQSQALMEASGLSAQEKQAMQAFDFSFLDTLNYSHLRDLLTLPVFDQLLTHQTEESATPVVIVSRQMGMIPYYLAIKYYKRVRFIDLRGLTTNDIMQCPLLINNKPHASSGILMTTQFYLENQDEIDKSCSLPHAQVVYDTGLIGNSADKTNDVLRNTGYTAYYVQKSRNDNLFAQYIGVRKLTP